MLELDGEPQAYAIYRLNFSYADGVPTGKTVVIEAMGVDPAATAAVWRYLFDIDWMVAIEAGLLPLDHPLFLLLLDPNRMKFRVGDGLWLRLVDVGAALAGRAYATEDELVFGVSDTFCPWNDGLLLARRRRRRRASPICASPRRRSGRPFSAGSPSPTCSARARSRRSRRARSPARTASSAPIRSPGARRFSSFC